MNQTAPTPERHTSSIRRHLLASAAGLAFSALAGVALSSPAQAQEGDAARECVTITLGSGHGPSVWTTGEWDLWILDAGGASYEFGAPGDGAKLTVESGADVERIQKCNELHTSPEPPAEPTVEPSLEPTVEPTPEPAVEPTVEPTPEPAVEPTVEPEPEPTVEPTVEPTTEPTVEPAVEPTTEPTVEPTVEPTPAPTAEPTVEPTPEPAAQPTAEPEPSPVVLAGTDQPSDPFTVGDAEVRGESLANTGPAHITLLLTIAGLLLAIGTTAAAVARLRPT